MTAARGTVILGSRMSRRITLAGFVVALALSPGAAAFDSLTFLGAIGPAPHAVGCTSVEQDYTRTGGAAPDGWWEGQPGPGGTTRYVTDLLATAATTVLPVTMTDDTWVFGTLANAVVPIAVMTCYPTDAGNPNLDYVLPTGAVVPRMQRGTQAPLVSSAKPRWPVLLYSHGFGGSPLAADDLAVVLRLAGQGYVVVAPFHGDPRLLGAPLKTAADLDAATIANGPLSGPFVAMQGARPVALIRALDDVLARPGFAERVDAAAIGGVGTSVGAASLMLMAGARVTKPNGLGSLDVVKDGRLKAIVALNAYFGSSYGGAFGYSLEGVERMHPVPLLSIGGSAYTWPYTLLRKLQHSRLLVVLERNASLGDPVTRDLVFAWTLPFLAAHVLDDRAERARIQRAKGTAFHSDDERWIDYTAPAPESPGERIVVEYYHADMRHYFYTADPAEAAMLDRGLAVAGWSRTGIAFKAWDRADDRGLSSCRFLTLGPASYSHFYTINGVECGNLLNDPSWHYEAQAYRAEPPVGPDDCPPGRVRVSRLYNKSAGGTPNHRFLTSNFEIDLMRAAGWQLEGSVFCTPP